VEYFVILTIEIKIKRTGVPRAATSFAAKVSRPERAIATIAPAALPTIADRSSHMHPFSITIAPESGLVVHAALHEGSDAASSNNNNKESH